MLYIHMACKLPPALPQSVLLSVDVQLKCHTAENYRLHHKKTLNNDWVSNLNVLLIWKEAFHKV